MSRYFFALALLLLAPIAVAQQETPLPPSQAPATLLRLAEVEREALASSPTVQRAETLLKAAQAHTPQAGLLPDPTVTLSWMGDPVPFKVQSGDPSSYRGLTVMQMFPLGGKRALEREVSRRDAAVEEVSLHSARRTLLTETRAAFFDYAYYDRALALTAQNHERLTQLAEVTEARYKVGKAMQQDVLRARLEVTMLLQRRIQLEQQKRTAAARLNTLMGRPASSELPPAEETSEPALPALEELTTKSEKSDLMIESDNRMAARESAEVDLLRKGHVPDLSVGYMYQQRPGMPDMHGMQFTVNLPRLHRERVEEQIAEGELKVKAARQGAAARRLELSYELQQSYAMASTARQMIDLYEQAVLPQAELARDSAQASYTVGSVDFLSVLTAYTSIYSYELDYQRQRADYAMALARLAGISGDIDGTTEAH